MNKLPVTVGLAMLVFSSTPVFAQLNESINVNSTMFRQLEKATRPAESPKYKDTSIATPKLSYTNIPAQAPTSVSFAPIVQAPLKMKEKLNRLYPGYVKLGFGNYTNFLGELSYHAGRARDYDYGISYKHLSSLGGIDDVAYSGFTNDAFEAYGKKLWNKMYGSISAGYERNQFHYYGFDPEDFAFTNDSSGFSKKDYRQVFHIPILKLETGTWRGDTSSLRHRESLMYRAFLDRYNTSEHYVLGSFSGGKFKNNEYYSLDASFDVNAYKMKDTSGLNIFYAPPVYTYTSQHTNGIIRLNPSVNTNLKQLKLRIGAVLALNAEDHGARFYFYPDIDLSYSLFKNMFIPYLRIGGNLDRNSLYSLSRENPFVLNNITPPNTHRKIDLSAGFKGSFGSRLSFNVSGGYAMYDDYILFMPDLNYSMGNRSTIVTDDVNILKFSGQLLFQSGTKWHVLAGGNYYIYETETQQKAWNRPDFDGSLALIYNLGNKLIGRINTTVAGKRYAMAPDPLIDGTPEYYESLELKPYVDADLQFEYRYTGRFSVFFNINNIASQRYLKWYGYPMQRFNVLGGLTYSF